MDAILLDDTVNNSSVCIGLQWEYKLVNYSSVFNDL